MEDDLVWEGRVARLVTTGWRSGDPRPVTVGFIEEPDGAILVAATDAETAWGRNLLHDPHCSISYGERRFEAIAEELGREEHGRVVRELILRYGTPSEGLGRGPSFRLRPVQGGG